MKPIILDTDIGTDVDDALALALVLRSPELQLHGVTTVHGNATLRAVIASRLTELADQPGVPVVAGRSAPLRRSTVQDFHWHSMWGHEGRGVLSAEERAVEEGDPVRDDAARFIAESAAERPGELSVIAVGPLTNVARAFELEPRLGELLADLTIMGGLVDASGFRWRPHFETNLNADPGAAEIVLRSGAPITLVPLEVTLQVYLTADQRALLSDGDDLSSALGRLIDEMRDPFLEFNDRYGLDGSEFDERTYMHDPLAVYASTHNEHVRFRRTHVDVVMEGPTLRAFERPDRSPNMRLCVGADGPAFAGFWLDRVVPGVRTGVG